MSGLRALQDETGDTFTGDWSWVPYLIMFVVLLFGAAPGVAARARRAATRRSTECMTRPPAAPRQPVTRADIEAKLAQIRGVADDTTEVAEGAAKTGLVIAGVGVVVVAFLLGRRRGRKKSTIVEVRRI